METLEIYLPALNGRMFTVSKFPERRAVLHRESHVGIDRKDGSRNIEKTTPIYLNNGKVFNLTPAVKRSALFFIPPAFEH